MNEIKIKLPPKLAPIFNTARYKVFYGGRGSAKSHSIARYLLIRSLQSRIRILCTREYQSSISDSVHKLLSDLIQDLHISSYFTVERSRIMTTMGSEFIFAGLAQHIESIKSYEGVDIVWVEEAATVSSNSLDILIPTIRKPGSEIIFSFNPKSTEDPVYKRFVLQNRPDCITVKMNYNDNPWFPEVLDKERIWMKETDYDKYRHVWEGEVMRHSQSQIFKGKFVIQDFEAPEDVIFYYGLDFGFSADPSCLIRCFMKDGNLYIDHERYGHHLELPQLASLIKTMPDISRGKIFADNSRPESIAYLYRIPFNIEACHKGPGSVEEGIEYIKSFKQIIISPRCENTIYEFNNYSYKVDKITGDVLPIVVDSNNHCIDALRYSLDSYITNSISILDVL